jgi:hypothetical protein
MVIIDELPFNFEEEGKGFRLFSRTVQPRFDIPSCFTVMENCLKLYVEEKERLKRALKGQRLCLTTDTWTSIQNINHMSITAHWIDNKWNLHKRILNWVRQLVKLLRIVTVDNASSSSFTISILKNVMKDWPTNILSNEHFHVRCCAYIVKWCSFERD